MYFAIIMSTTRDFAYKLEYENTVDSIAHYFWRSVSERTTGSRPYYTWFYRERGRKGRPPRPEDLSHGGFDVTAIVHIHKDRGIGTGEQMQLLANTLIDVAQYDTRHHYFSYYIDGSEKRNQQRNQQRNQRNSLRWLALCEWDKRVFDNANWIISRRAPRKAFSLCRISLL